MTLDTKPLAEVTSRAVEILIRELGPSDAIRFITPVSDSKTKTRARDNSGAFTSK